MSNSNVNFSFEAFSTLEETSKFLSKNGKDALISAGSTDVLVHIQKKGYPKHVVSLSKIGDLNYIKEETGEVKIGALTTLTEISESAILMEKCPALVKAARQIGSPQIRNRGTIGGNICNASPAADTAPSLLVYDAKVKIFNNGSMKEVNISEFFVGPGRSVLEAGDIVVEFIVPVNEKAVSGFVKVGKRKALEISIINMAMNLVVENNVIKTAKVACGSVAPTPVLVSKTSDALVGLKVETEADLNDVIEVIRNEVTPIDDIRGTASYRSHMIGITFRRLLMELVGSDK